MEKCLGGQFSVYMYKAISSKRISLDLEALQFVNTDFPGGKAKKKKKRWSVDSVIEKVAQHTKKPKTEMQQLIKTLPCTKTKMCGLLRTVHLHLFHLRITVTTLPCSGLWETWNTAWYGADWRNASNELFPGRHLRRLGLLWWILQNRWHWPCNVHRRKLDLTGPDLR